MRIRPENTTRKIDTLGRVTIPKGLRDRMGIKVNDDMELFTMEHEGKEYICLSAVETVPFKYLMAAQVLEELGVEMPDALATQLM